ncbi:MAG: PCMD domain-containing protein [Bacteroidales bacterium]|nr:PCMD domain-containing protein [Bacteroidales bacterium]
MRRPLLLLNLSILLFPLLFYGQQIDNPGFEAWEDITSILKEPVNWSTIKTADDPYIASVAPVTFEQSIEARTGDYALKLYNVNAFGIIATGAITNGRFHAEFNIDNSYAYTDTTDLQWHQPFTWRPDSLAGWFRFYPQDNDICQFKVILHVKEAKMPEFGTLPNWVGMAQFRSEPGVTYDNWTRFSVPFEYFQDINPRYLLCVINSGDSISAFADSWLLADDLELIYEPSGINDPVAQEPFVRIHHHFLTIELANASDYLNHWFTLTDLSGRIIISDQLSSNRVALPVHMNRGMYIATLQGYDKKRTQKIMIH